MATLILRHPAKDRPIIRTQQVLKGYKRKPDLVRLDNLIGLDTETDPITNDLRSVQLSGSTSPDDLSPYSVFIAYPQGDMDQMEWMLDAILTHVEHIHGKEYLAGRLNGSHKGKRQIQANTIQLWAHNWHFDLVRIFGPDRVRMLGMEHINKAEISTSRFSITVVDVIYTSKVVFGTLLIRDWATNRTLRLVMRDSSAYFVGESLESASESLKSPFKKMDKPDFAGEMDQAYIDYSIQDARAVWWLGLTACQMNNSQGIGAKGGLPKPTIGSFAGSILKLHFGPDDSFNYHGEEEEQFALNCLRGGYTGTISRGTFHGCFADFKSLYPWSMAYAAPNMNGAGVLWTDSFKQDLEGYYHIRARFTDNQHPSYLHYDQTMGMLIPVYSPDIPIEGWITSYELRSGLHWGSIQDMEVIRGLVVMPFHKQDEDNPLRNTILDLYSIKQHEDTKKQAGLPYSMVAREASKRAMNSMQGKTLEVHGNWRTLPEDDGLSIMVPDNILGPQRDQLLVDARDRYLSSGIEGVNDLQEQIFKLSGLRGGKLEPISVEPRELVAGILFNPVLAGLITGAARARVHDLMCIIDANLWDTDSSGCSMGLAEAKAAVSAWVPYAGTTPIEVADHRQLLGSLEFEGCPHCGAVFDQATIVVDKVKRYEIYCSKCGRLAKGEYHLVRSKKRHGAKAFKAIYEGGTYRHSKLTMQGPHTRRKGIGLIPPEEIGLLVEQWFVAQMYIDKRLSMRYARTLDTFTRGEYKRIQQIEGSDFFK